jgi:AraC family transcriptional regulator, regulatory protein of adaptative response / DNA-3-methyladenine glycosylase II
VDCLDRGDGDRTLCVDRAQGSDGTRSRASRPAGSGLVEAVRIRPIFDVADRYTVSVAAFSAVVTTGIYCRPGCSAQPRSKNVRAYLLPAAAEADGYRACLRCRPYRSPQLALWAGGPELVCRAVGLILDGALDGATEAELGARLGVSARHLRRLFMEHLGVTPGGLARSARTHFARRLLDDTDLTILEIAFAAGFGSVRQLNRACNEVFRQSPRALRARRRVTDRLAADGGLLLRLPFKGRLDWPAMLDYFAARASPGVEDVFDGVYRRTIVVDGDPGVIELLPGGEDHLLLRAHLPHWRELIHIVERSRRIPSLELDPDEPAGHLAADPIIGPLLRARPGVRTPGTWDPFETGVRAIIGQQVTVSAANTITGRLVARLGEPVAGLRQLGLTHTFPSPEKVASADLSGLGMPRARAEAIRSFASAVADDSIRLDRSLSLDRFVAAVTAIDGLGPWTAHYLALRIGERDACPTTDLGLRRALARHGRSIKAIEELADHWRPWRALAATHLWFADNAEQPPTANVDAA